MCKRIAVYYCGGCNPRYDRVGAVRALAAQLPALRFGGNPVCCAGALAVCGCAVGCVAPRVPQAQPVYILRGAEELPAAQQWLLALENA